MIRTAHIFIGKAKRGRSEAFEPLFCHSALTNVDSGEVSAIYISVVWYIKLGQLWSIRNQYHIPHGGLGQIRFIKGGKKKGKTVGGKPIF